MFQRDRQNCILRFQSKTSTKNISVKIFFSEKFMGFFSISEFEQETLRKLGENFSAMSSILHSTCPEEQFKEKVF